MDTGPESPSSLPFGSDNPYSSPTAATGERLHIATANTLNPWLSIWMQPRRTIRQIVDTNATQHVLLLAALSGIFQTLDRASMRSAGDSLSFVTLFGMAAIAGPIFGLVMLYIAGWVLRWSGSGLLGGVATAKQVRAAIAWGGVPALVSNVLWVPQFAILGSKMFTSDKPSMEDSPALLAILMITFLLEAAAGVWSFVATMKCLGEVHRFSAWRALASTVLPAVLIAVIGVLVAMLLAVIPFMYR